MKKGQKKGKPRNNIKIQKLDIKINLTEIDYKNISMLKKFLDSRQKIYNREKTGLSAKKQRKLKTEIKKARIMGLLPFTDRHSLG